MDDLLRVANRVAQALGHLSRDLERDDPATRSRDRSVARMLRQLSGELERAVEAHLPQTGPLDHAVAPPSAARGREH